MEKTLWKKSVKPLLFMLLILTACVTFQVTAKEAQAASIGFKKIGTKTYYIDKDGSKHKGWLTLNGKKYYFDKKTGVQLKGWQYNSKGKIVRYFSTSKGCMITGWVKNAKGQYRYFDPKTGVMATGLKTIGKSTYFFSSSTGIRASGWLKNSKGQKRYFNPSNGKMRTGWVKNAKGQYRYFDKSTGYMYTGLKRLSGYYYYFDTKTGYRYQGGFLDISGNRYYFSPASGRARTGWLTLNNKRYYFNTKGVLYVNRTIKVSGQTYTVDKDGVATASSYTIQGNNVNVYDTKNGRNYLLMKEYIEHPGVANGTVSDLELLAALCDSEAGDQGKIGMEAVALCILNRTIKKDKEFPSQVRYVIYQGVNFAQYSVVTNGALLRRLKGSYTNKTAAFQAAQAALTLFQNYVTKGTPRKLSGFKTSDFNYMYFMMESTFWAQPLNFKKVKYYLYKDHMFFVDWIAA